MARRYLAFETGGTKLVAAVAAADGRLVETRQVERGRDDAAETSLTRLINLGRALRVEHERTGATFAATALGFGGTVDRVNRRPHRCLHEDGWDAIDVVGRLEEAFTLPSAIENDCKLAALAEAWFGAGEGARTVFYVTLGTGVGGGLVSNGRIVELGPMGEAEIGHVVIDPDGPKCWCGGRGCVEAMCSGPGISRLAAWLAERRPELWMQSPFQGEPEAVSSKDYLASGDGFSRELIERSADALAQALAAAVNLTAAEAVVIGGGVGSGNPQFVDRVRQKTLPRVVGYFRERCRIEVSRLGADVVAQGAALLARKTAASTA